MVFKNRVEAGEKLAEKLVHYKGRDALVAGIPRGGMVVAREVAQHLLLPLDICVVKKLSHPACSEYAIGAMGEGGEAVFDEKSCQYFDQEEREKEVRRVQEKIGAQLKEFASGCGRVDWKGKTAIIVDDGIATGWTMRAAIASARKKGATSIVVAAPVIAAETVAFLKSEADELVYLDAPAVFFAVGQFYQEFGQVSEDEVKKLLAREL